MNTIQLQTFGGQIVHARLMGKNIFYCSETPQAPPTPTRGGVPVLFPQFASLGPLPKHGYARTQEWQLFTVLDDCASANLLLTEQPDWPHRAQLNVDASVEDEHMSIFFEVRNVGDTSFFWTGGLHPYFLVGDVLQSTIHGLVEEPIYHVGTHGLAYIRNAHAIDEAHAITSSLTLYSPNVNLLLEQEGFDAWQVWNPSDQHELKDIPHADWQKFLCIEPVVLTPKTLAVGETWVGRFDITLVDDHR